MSPADEPQLAPTPQRGPGEELAAARERAGIERADMAVNLHLPERQLEALERDDYSELPPPAFVRGYLRAYARQVGIDGDQIIEAYESLGVADRDPELRLTRTSDSQPSGRGAVVGLAVVTLLVLAGVAGWWWQGRDAGLDITGPEVSSAESATGEAGTQAEGNVTGETAGTAQDADAAATDNGTESENGTTGTAGEPANGTDPAGDAGAASEEATATADAEAAAAGEGAGSPDDAESAGQATTSGSNGTGATGPADDATNTTAASGEATGTGEQAAASVDAQSPDEPAADTTVATADGSADDTVTTAPSGGTTQTDTAAGDAEPAPETEPEAEAEGQPEPEPYQPPNVTASAERATAPAAAQGPDAVVLAVDGRSWIEVTDAEGRQLVYTLYTGAEPLELRGYAPFDIFLGNSPAVEVRFRGQAVGKSAFTRSDNTARFLVDENGARRP